VCTPPNWWLTPLLSSLCVNCETAVYFGIEHVLVVTTAAAWRQTSTTWRHRWPLSTRTGARATRCACDDVCSTMAWCCSVQRSASPSFYWRCSSPRRRCRSSCPAPCPSSSSAVYLYSPSVPRPIPPRSPSSVSKHSVSFIGLILRTPGPFNVFILLNGWICLHGVLD